MEANKSEKKRGNITRWWLQLQFAFFQDKRIRALRRKYGDLSLIIYLKMMLKSLENNYRMKFEGLEDSFEEEIAIDIAEDESEKIPLIKDIVAFLIKHELMVEEESSAYYFPQAAKMCARETDSAERTRRYRERRREMLQCNDTMLQENTENDGDASQCNNTLSQANTKSNGDASQCRGNNSNSKTNNKIKEENNNINYQEIINMYNDTCVSFPRVTKLSDARKKAIKARLNTYSVEDFRKLFEMAEGSRFLKGENNRNWRCNFDWMIKDANFAKILDGNYQDKDKPDEGERREKKSRYADYKEPSYLDAFAGCKPGPDDPFQ